MPGHTYTDLKRYADAAYQQEGSARVDHACMARDRIMPFEIHNYAHNNQWLATIATATSAGSATRSPSPGTWSSSPATPTRTARTTAARPSGAAGSAGPRSWPATNSGTT